MLVEVCDELAGIICFQVATIMGDDLAVLKGDEVTADGEVVVCHLVAYAGSLQGSATFIDCVEIVTEDGCVGYFRTGREAFGHCDEATCAPFACQLVHIFRSCILQECLITEAGHLVVSHTVSEDDEVFHSGLDISN